MRSRHRPDQPAPRRLAWDRLGDTLAAPPWSVRLLLAAAGGVLYFVGYAGFDQWYLSWVALVPVLAALRGAPSWRQTAIVAFVAGLVTHLGGFYWVAHVAHNYGGFGWPLAIGFCLLLCAFQALQLVAWALALRWLDAPAAGPAGGGARLARLPLGLAAPLAWVAVEFGWPMLFPNYYGNSQYERTWLVQIADLGGVLLVSALVVAANGLLYEALRAALARRWRLLAGWLGTAGLLVGVSLGYGAWRVAEVEGRLADAPRLRVAMVQANLWLHEKGREPRVDLERHWRLSQLAEAQGARLIVWPETGYPYSVDTSQRDLRQAVLGSLRTPLVFGAPAVLWLPDPRRPGETRRVLRNSAFALDGNGQVQGRYDKHYRLMFGEYLPWGEELPWLYELSPHSGRYTAGDTNQVLRLPGLGPPGVAGSQAASELRLGVNICYEDIIPGHIHALAQGEPHLLINLTNDAWFDTTTEPAIHLALATFRSVEHHRAMARSTNTGYSAFIDPLGRITTRSGLRREALLVGELPLLTGRTLFGATGQWPGWLALAATLALAVLAWRRRSRKA